MSKKKQRKDLLTLAEWCEDMARHHIALALEDTRSKQQVRSLRFKAKRLGQCATALRAMNNESHSGGDPGVKSACLPADDRGLAEARSNPSTRSDSKSETADQAGGQQHCLGGAGEHGALDTRSVLTPRRSSSDCYCRKCGSFDIEPYVR